MLFQRPVRERVISRIIFYSGVLVFLMLMDVTQQIALAERIDEQRRAAGIVDSPDQNAEKEGVIASILRRFL